MGVLLSALMALLVLGSGCYTATRVAYKFQPKVPGEIPVDFAFKLRDVKVVDSSYMGFEDKTRPVLSMEERLKLRFDPTHRDPDNGLDLFIEYQEEALPSRFIPDSVPMGFPLRYPLLDAVIPSIKTRRYEITAKTRVLNQERKILYTKETKLLVKRKFQRGMFVGVIFVTIFPVRGEFSETYGLARNYRHEAMARMVIQDLRQTSARERLKKEYERQVARSPSEKAAAKKVEAPAAPPEPATP